MNHFEVRVHLGEDPQTAVISLSGSMDLAALSPIQEVFAQLVVDGRCLVVVDCEFVDFIASPAVGVLMGERRRMQECGGDLVLAALGETLQEKMNLMGANRVFRCYPDVPAACRDYHWEHFEQVEEFHLEIPAKAVYVPALRRVVSGVVVQKGYTEKDAYRIETIVDELANNAIEHGDPEQQKYYIDLGVSRKKIEISVRNAHRPMDPLALEAVRTKFSDPVVNDQSIRGRGLALVKKLSDHLELQMESDQTLVRVTKLREV